MFERCETYIVVDKDTLTASDSFLILIEYFSSSPIVFSWIILLIFGRTSDLRIISFSSPPLLV